MTIIGGFSLLESRNVLLNQVFNQLDSIRDVKKDQLEVFFNERKNDLHTLLDTISIFQQNTFQRIQTVQDYQKNQLENYFQQHLHNANILSANNLFAKTIAEVEIQVHEKNNPAELDKHKALFGKELQRYQQSYDYDDMLIIAKDGDIVYSVQEREDLGQNILQGKLKNTHLYKAFKKGLNDIAIQDFAPYPPANNQYLAFITAPIYYNNELVGVWIFSLQPKTINKIINQRNSMDGNTHLVGQIEDHINYSNSRL